MIGLVEIFLTLTVFIFGISVGSFLNVLIDRLPKGRQFDFGRSHCDYCRRKLGFFDLFPLFSFLFLKGRCRYCRQKISFYYPLVEVLTGLIFIICYKFYKPFTLASSFYLLTSLTVISSLIVIFFADLKYCIIPDEMIIIGLIASFFYLLISLSLNIFISYFLSGLVTSVFFLLLFVITRGNGLGFGDVKLAFLMGLFLGWPKILAAVYLAFLTGAVVGVILILSGKKKFGQVIPFGPFLVLGTIIAFFFSQEWVNQWLVNFF